ncbi:hypothetical protein K469DRAFT_778347 [Zopfia rhizophila CBS 207.26]|uniref:Uncharacterized protein n=1 Tax=Zopfia rhizophila CBS 207.26 TaxID=1314779 RepID=A0A6A6E5Q5_9PEZI|nr:hypothetical protein K469DRAFT_778347 [Zopfia rhizophila CBS 207.26]
MPYRVWEIVSKLKKAWDRVVFRLLSTLSTLVMKRGNFRVFREQRSPCINAFEDAIAGNYRGPMRIPSKVFTQTSTRRAASTERNIITGIKKAEAQPSQRISTTTSILGQLIKDLVDQTSVKRARLKKHSKPTSFTTSTSLPAGDSKLPRRVKEKSPNHSRLSPLLRAEDFEGRKAIYQTRWSRSVGPEKLPQTYSSFWSHNELEPV